MAPKSGSNMPMVCITTRFLNQSCLNAGCENEQHTTSISDFLTDVCLLNICYAVLHLTFVVLLSVVHVVSSQLCFHQADDNLQQYQTRRFPPKFATQHIRWILLGVFLLQVTAVVEGILTAQTGGSSDDSMSEMLLYIPPICALFGAIIATLLNLHADTWQQANIRQIVTSLLLLAYWIISFGLECLRLAHFVQQDLNDSTIVRFNLIIVLIILYGMLFSAQGYQVICAGVRNKVIKDN